MKTFRDILIELFSTRRIIALMLMATGLSISQLQSTLVNQTIGSNSIASSFGLVTMLCALLLGWKPYTRFSGLLATPLLLYSILNVWYAIYRNTWLPLGAFFSAGIFAIVWTDLLKPVTIIKVSEPMTPKVISIEPVVKTLLNSKRFRSAIIGIVAIVLIQLFPPLAPKADLISAIVASLMGLLIAGYSYTDAQTDANARPPGLADAIQIALIEAINALFTSPPASGSTLAASSASTPLVTDSRTIQVQHPQTGAVVYITASASNKPPVLDKAPPTTGSGGDNGVTLPGDKNQPSRTPAGN